MNSIANIIGPIYQNLLGLCEKRKIAINLDLENPSRKIRQEPLLRQFLKDSLSVAIKSCKPGNKITIAQDLSEDNSIHFSVKYDGDVLDNTQKAALIEKEYNVRSRYGYGNTISIEIN
jgi:hypothetical protein